MGFRGAFRYRDFRLLWTARTVSVLGDQFWRLGLPSIAILVLGASAAEVGALNAVGFLAWPTLAMVAGVWVDRLRRRPVMVVADLGRGLAVASIPIAFVTGHLQLWHLYVVAAAVGAMDVFFELAAVAHVPALVPRESWADANAKLEMGTQAASAGGPAAAGVLIGLGSAPLALVMDAASFVISATSLARTRAVLHHPAVARRSLLSEAMDGLRYLRRQPVLLRIALAAGVSNVGLLMAQAVQLLFLYRVVGLPPLLVGVCLGGASAGSLLGAAATRRVMTRLGTHRALMVSSALEGLAWLLTPLCAFAPPVPLLLTGLALSGFWGTVWNVGVTTFRQHRIEPELMGRVTAAGRMIAFGALPVGSALGGLLGQQLTRHFGARTGLTVTLVVSALVAASSALVLMRGAPDFQEPEAVSPGSGPRTGHGHASERCSEPVAVQCSERSSAPGSAATLLESVRVDTGPAGHIEPEGNPEWQDPGWLAAQWSC